MAVPAVLISTVWGALNGYVLSLWKFRGSDTLFGLLLFRRVHALPGGAAAHEPGAGLAGLSSSITGLVLVHCLAGLAGTTLFFRNYYAAIPKELVNAARMDGAGFWQIFWRIVLPLSTPIFMVTLIWQFTNIWNDFLFGVVFSGTESKPITVGLNNLANTSSSVKAYNVDMAAAIIAGLPTMVIYVLAGKVFCARADGRRSEKGNPRWSPSWRHVVARSSCAYCRHLSWASITLWQRRSKAWRTARAWTSTSRRASSSSWWAPRAAANPRCSTSLRGWTSRPKGEIRIGGKNVVGMPPRDRDIAMVFQSYALYPTMSVADNIGFALEMRKMPKAERQKRIDEVAAMLQISHLLDRRPSQLSGGQRQRVAMGRALARQPQLFLV
jgi:energy-coupling factor transporter ATP-binding protein EcfA2